MINMERAAMRGRLAELKAKTFRLRMRIEGNCRAIRTGLNTMLTPIEEIEAPMLAGQMDELVMAWGELTAAMGEIRRIEKELA